MEYEKAIKAIKANYPPSNYTILREALDLSMELLGKQEPISVVQIEQHKYMCPKCGNIYHTVDYDLNIKYCDECGQRLDWE